MAKQWFIVHTYSGFERKVEESLHSRIQAFGVEEEFGQILVPTEDVVEMKAGKRVTSSKMTFPGYVLVRWRCLTRPGTSLRILRVLLALLVPGVKPSPLSQQEVDQIIHHRKPPPKSPSSVDI